ncbi:MAG: hypothetical protein D6788_06750 [Planctomycetota bacterium]|nr:MAG: hypothetical protein D6788_06750 [Planctomycetota bacterium]
MMGSHTWMRRVLFVGLSISIVSAGIGCGPHYRTLRREGQSLMAAGKFAAAKQLFLQAEDKSPRHVDNLTDLGACSVMLARQRLAEMNQAAALREVDDAIAYYSRALDVYPGHQPAIEGKNVALELKGQFEQALKEAEWTARNVGPAAKNYLFLARELEERGDVDGALLRYRQAVAIEPRNVDAHIAFARFLLKHDNEKAAVHHLQAAYRLDPLNEWVMDQLARRGKLPPLTPVGQEIPSSGGG